MWCASAGIRPLTMQDRVAKRAGSGRLNSFRVSISVILPGLRCFLPHRVGRGKGVARLKVPSYAAAEISCAAAKDRGVK